MNEDKHQTAKPRIVRVVDRNGAHWMVVSFEVKLVGAFHLEDNWFVGLWMRNEQSGEPAIVMGPFKDDELALKQLRIIEDQL